MATEELVKSVVKMLQSELKGVLPKAGMQKIWPDMLKEPDKAIELAYDHFILKGSFIPSPDALLKQVQYHGREIRMREAAENEADLARQKAGWGEQSYLTKEQRTEYGKRSQAIMLMATPCHDGVPYQPSANKRKEIAGECRKMAADFPTAAAEWHDLADYFTGRS